MGSPTSAGSMSSKTATKNYYVSHTLHISQDAELLNSLIKAVRTRLGGNTTPATRDLRALLKVLSSIGSAPGRSAIVLVGSASAGWVIRSDYVAFRLRQTRCAESIHHLAVPRGWIPAMPPGCGGGNQTELNDLLPASLSVLFVQANDKDDLLSKLARLSKLLANRVDTPLTLPKPIEPKTVAVVGGGLNMAYRRAFLEAAAALGIGLVILDRPGHWMASHPELCEAFVPLDTTVDSELSNRIVAACQMHGRLDGLTTYADEYLEATARASQRLGLSAESPEALRTCTRKNEFRRLFPISQCPSLKVASIDEFFVGASAFEAHYPLIIKPPSGGNSVGVSKATCRAEAEDQISRLLQTQSSALVEKYIQGPEVDVNVALINGEIAFYDIVDEPPCSAETCETSAPSGSPSSFIEPSAMWPSILPANEQGVLYKMVSEGLAHLGFKNGVFHIEARMIDSAMQWAPKRLGGLDEPLWSLGWKQEEQKCLPNPEAMMIEANARTPGYPAALGSVYCSGIDFATIQLLLCISDTVRARSLSVPFRDSGNACVITYAVLTPRGGTFQGENMYQELARSHPDLSEAILEPILFFKDGDIIKDPRERASWLTTFTMRCEAGREEAMVVGERIQRHLQYSIV